MSWGRPPTDEQHSVPVARRRSSRDPITLAWVPIWGELGQQPHAAQTAFEHRDQRIWSFWISKIGDDNPLHGYGYSYYMQGTSSGCEPVRFVSPRMHGVKRTAQRFANMAMDNYAVLVADAEGTSDHPIKGKVAMISIRTERRVRRSALPSDYDIEYDQEERTGRVDGSKVTLFPTQDEINDVLETVLVDSTEIVERLIEENGLEQRQTRRSNPTTSAPMQRPIVTGSLYESRRQFGAAAASLDAMCAPDEREERSIQL